MFRGVATLNLDAKGRLAIPAKHRDALMVRCNGRLIITADPSKCLLIYPQPDWEPIQEQLMSMPSFNKQARNLQRLLVGHAEDVEMDGAGRILISAPLRKFASLDKHVMFAGQGHKFELWDEQKWHEQRDEGLAVQGELALPDEMMNFSL